MNTVSFRLALAQAASGLIGGMYTPFFGAWLGWKGLSPSQIGALLAAGMLLRVVIAPVGGVIADARDDRRGAMLVFYTVALCGYAALNWTDTTALIFTAAIQLGGMASLALPIVGWILMVSALTLSGLYAVYQVAEAITATTYPATARRKRSISRSSL